MKRRNHNKRNIALVLLLAVLCIGTAELAACRRFAPALYQELMAPVYKASAVLSEVCHQAAAYTLQRWQTVQGELAALRAEVEVRLAEAEARRAEAKARAEAEAKALSEPPPDDQEVSQPALDTPIIYSAVTELRLVEGRQVLTGGWLDIVYFNQGDEDWAELPYGSDDIGRYGCGPTAMAIVVASLTEEETDPVQMAQWAVEHGYWARRSGSYHSIVEGAAQAFGLEAESFTDWTPEGVTSALAEGKLLVALMGPGHFTQGGHFIVLRGVAPSGNLLVADPSSLDRSLTTWDPQLILDELSHSRTSGAPVWAVARPAA